MEGPRLGDAAAVPEPDGRIVHSWVPDDGCGCGFCGAETYGYGEAELAAKLAVKYGG